jgi:hypothetical protein
LRQIKLLLPKDMIFPQGKTNFFEEQWSSPKENTSSLKKHMF